MENVTRAFRGSKDRPLVAHVAFDDLGVEAVEIASRAARPHQSAQSKSCPGKLSRHRRSDKTGSPGDEDAILGRHCLAPCGEVGRGRQRVSVKADLGEGVTLGDGGQ
jgi:hypothetical protein